MTINDAKFFPQDLCYLANQIDLEKWMKRITLSVIRIIENLAARIKSNEKALIKYHNHHVFNKS